MLVHASVALVALALASQPASLPPPSAELARRVFEANRAARVIPRVVIVTGAPGYLEAIAAWDGDTRFPVLWDDGSPEARVDIARFVRAFGPESVVRFEPQEPDAWPGQAPGRIARIERALFDAVLEPNSVHSTQQMIDALRDSGRMGPGLVLTDVHQGLWPGALALAAGRGQPIVFTSGRGRLSAALSIDEATDLERFVRTFADGLGLSWQGMGDDLDAITLGIECPAKVRVGEQPADFLATTDVLGRNDGPGRPRWGYAGQLFGDEPRSAYLAMCSLFLAPRSAWIFDAYESGAPWNQFDGTATSNVLQASGWQTTLFDEPRQGLEHWRAACIRPLDAGLVLVNTMGNGDFFRLRPGDGSPGDVPILGSPAAVYFVHSFSATRPGNIDTVGGRWLDHGAYVYVGSVQEPTLGGFVPTPNVVQRALAGLPLAAASRPDAGPPWKIAFFGDPLAALVPPTTRIDAPLPLEDVHDLAEESRAAVTERRFADAMVRLALLGRNDDVARLAGGLLKDEPGSFDTDAARAAMVPLFCAGKPDRVVECFRRLSPADQKRTLFLDALWLAARLRMDTDADVAALLAGNLREDQLAADAIELSAALARQHGSQAAVGLLQSARARLDNERDRRRLDGQIQRLLSGRGP